MDDLRLLPREGTFVFRDYLASPPGGKATYWAQRGLIRQVGWVRVDCRTRCGEWELTDRARKLLEDKNRVL